MTENMGPSSDESRPSTASRASTAPCNPVGHPGGGGHLIDSDHFQQAVEATGEFGDFATAEGVSGHGTRMPHGETVGAEQVCEARRSARQDPSDGRRMNQFGTPITLCSAMTLKPKRI